MYEKVANVEVNIGKHTESPPRNHLSVLGKAEAIPVLFPGASLDRDVGKQQLLSVFHDYCHKA
jgi:hypothetical protein